MKTYYVTMEDGRLMNFRSNSAAEAIQQGLSKHLGYRVIGCFVGGFDERGQPNHDRFPGGRTDFEVPPHEPLLKAPAASRRRDSSEALFENEGEIIAESGAASARMKTEHENAERAAEELRHIVVTRDAKPT